LAFVDISWFMKIEIRFILAFAAAVLLRVGAHAQEIDGYAGPGFIEGYNDGDLVLVFFSGSDASQSSGGNSHGDLLFNLGPASSFTGLAAGTYSVAGFDGSAGETGQGAPDWGSLDLKGSLSVPSSSTLWTVMGSNETTDQLWLSGITSQAQLSASSQDTIAIRINGIGSGAANNANADGSAYDSAQTTGNYLLVDGEWTDTAAVADSAVSASGSSMGLYSMSPGTRGSGSSTLLGTFNLVENGGLFTLTFTVPQAQGPTQPGTGSHLVNISSRAYVGTGANLEIAGFVVSGPPGSVEQVLVRAVGPTLSQYGVDGVLANPVLTLFNSAGEQLAANTGWSTSPDASAIAAAAAATGAFSLSEGSTDSAILASLAPGAYTAEVVGANGAAGVALAEVYEVDSGGGELINISTRAYVGTGSSVEIGGFYIQGSQPETVLVRAVGPTLGQFGVTGALAETSLSVIDSSGNSVATNTGWSSNPNAAEIAAETAATGAFALPAGSADSALLLTLPPGAYTAVVSGANGASGVALVEVYQAP
jgi:hypothetical protein